ncbi:MAG: polysaccharide pyruvyl transferase family protein [Chloroflexota bacterium]
MKIALIHIHSYHNSGDAALTESAVKNLLENFPGCQLTLLINDPQSYTGGQPYVPSLLHWIKRPGGSKPLRFAWLLLTGFLAAVGKRFFGKPIDLPGSPELKAALAALMEADLVVGTPGGYLYSYASGRALQILLITFMIALAAGRPVYLLPQSYGPFRTRLERWMTGFVLQHARLVMVREPASIPHLAACGLPAQASILLPDMAFAFQSAPDSQAAGMLHQWLPKRMQPLLGVTVINWGDQFQGFHKQAEYEQAVAAGIRSFIQVHPTTQVLFLPQCCGPSEHEDDRIPARRIAGILNAYQQQVTLVETPLAAVLLSAVFGQMDLFLGTRMHSNIFALSHRVPVVAIGYLHKSRGIAQAAGITDWVLDIQQLTAGQLSEKLLALWENRQAVRAHLETIMPELADQARLPAQLIAADYHS